MKINKEKLLVDYLKKVEYLYIELEHKEYFEPREIVDILVGLIETGEYERDKMS